jgi:hypothetical protein
MDIELELLNKIIHNERLISQVKFTLTFLIKKLIQLKINTFSFFSSDIKTFGNIGKSLNQIDHDKKLSYILSDDSTIREKLTVIKNAIVSGESCETNNEILLDYIMKRDPHNKWLLSRANFIDMLKHNNLFDQIGIKYRWSPLQYLFSEYRTKINITKPYQYINSYTTPTSDDLIHASELSESLSDYEKTFLVNNGYDIINPLPMITGKYIYKNIINMLPEYVAGNRDKSLIISGLSGHSMVLLDLCLIIGVKWIPIFFACIISQVPHHHSMIEIIDTLIDMKLVNVNNSYLDTIIGLAKKIDICL